MIILYWMSPDPIVAQRGDSLLEVVRLMREHTVRRLPVVEGEDQLCGIIGGTDVVRHVGRLDSAPLSPELERALAAVPIEEAMTPNPATCDTHDYVETVCQRMTEEKVGAYPVLRRNHLVGILSETDLLRALAELSYAGSPGRRITLRLPLDHEENYLYGIVSLCRRFQLRLRTILTHPILDESATMATLRVDGARVDDFVASLWRQGYKVVDDG